MSASAKKKRDRNAPKNQVKAKKPEQPQPVKDRNLEADDIERAVYDGMQDLRRVRH